MKGLARKTKLNEGHVKAARVYKARVASLTFERTELQDAACDRGGREAQI